MTNLCRLLSCLRAWAAIAVATAALAGCQSLQVNNDLVEQPIPEGMVPPRELRKVSLPSYRIEPPDIIAIEMPKMVPLPPYRAEIYDVLEVHVTNALPDQPIDNYYMIEAEGGLNLGPAYGTIRAVGMTLDEAKKAIEQKLTAVLREPEVSVKLARVSSSQQVSAQYLVGPDGTINLHQYGLVHVAGLTVTEARLVLQKHLAHYLDSPELSVDVIAYNSKVYYIITQGAGIGDNVRRFPVTGNETVLDAISQVNGISQLSSTHMWIARPAPGNFGCEQVMPIDWTAISQGGSTTTNYQLMPGDRLFIAQDDLVALNNWVNKIVAPFERFMGFMGLDASTVRNLQTMGRDYNHNNNNSTIP